MSEQKTYAADTGFTENLGQNDTAAAIRAGMQLGTAQRIDLEGRPFVAVPDGMELMDYTELLPAPTRIKATRNFEEPDSFCAYVGAFSSPGTRLYGLPDDLKIAAVLDDHLPDKPSWGNHQAILALKYSPEWKRWLEACKESLGQQDLATFFEENIATIAQPDESELLSDIRSIHISTNTKCDSVQREGGDIAFAYSTETSAGTKTARQNSLPPYPFYRALPFMAAHTGRRHPCLSPVERKRTTLFHEDASGG